MQDFLGHDIVLSRTWPVPRWNQQTVSSSSVTRCSFCVPQVCPFIFSAHRRMVTAALPSAAQYCCARTCLRSEVHCLCRTPLRLRRWTRQPYSAACLSRSTKDAMNDYSQILHFYDGAAAEQQSIFPHKNTSISVVRASKFLSTDTSIYLFVIAPLNMNIQVC